MRSSAVGMWVWVPMTAVMRPSRVPAEGDFFAGGFAVEVKQDDFGSGFALDVAEEFVALRKGSSQLDMRDAALEVHDGVALAVGELALVEAEAWGADGIVGGAEDAAPRRWESAGQSCIRRSLFCPKMWLPVVMTWAPRSKQLFRDRGVRPKPPAAFSPLMTRRSTSLVSSTWGKMFADDVAAGGAKDIADEEDIHWKSLTRCGESGDRGLRGKTRYGNRRLRLRRGICCWVFSFLCMAQSGRFQLSVRVLAVLASGAGCMHTSSAIAETLKESAVMVRRTFLLLHKAGLLCSGRGRTAVRS